MTTLLTGLFIQDTDGASLDYIEEIIVTQPGFLYFKRISLSNYFVAFSTQDAAAAAKNTIKSCYPDAIQCYVSTPALVQRYSARLAETPPITPRSMFQPQNTYWQNPQGPVRSRSPFPQSGLFRSTVPQRSPRTSSSCALLLINNLFSFTTIAIFLELIFLLLLLTHQTSSTHSPYFFSPRNLLSYGALSLRLHRKTISVWY